MKRSSSTAVTDIYRSLQRNIAKTPLDLITRQKLQSLTHNEFELPISSNRRIESETEPTLYKLLLKVSRYQELLLNIQRNGHKNSVETILQLVYIDSVPLRDRAPSWLCDFLTTHATTRISKDDFVSRYDKILKLKHLIEGYESPKYDLKGVYFDTLVDNQTPKKKSILEALGMREEKNTVAEVTKTTQTTRKGKVLKKVQEKPINAEKSKKVISNDLEQYPELIKLIRFRDEYRLKLTRKIKIPSLELTIPPTLFGTPLTNIRIANLKVKRLLALQQYFAKSQPLKTSDLHYLKSIFSETFFIKHDDDGSKRTAIKEGYRLFLENSYCVTDEGQVIPSNISQCIFDASENLVKLFKD
ncbi:hypothetical protein CANARDRAFT_26963 [[Candida] arabinofermentans NRRL YB-2248]|uniref:Uncharacterized protein n=1 Tax=[Candida] arabinofermentans NRRL YB-2248 TaxID=983967 RepID=A0A1E4T740_9ASCO|nr:hypothetical protein CANARDRAFT_26963 [[Candida] arabinofermentans NRRL YB-2248]